MRSSWPAVTAVRQPTITPASEDWEEGSSRPATVSGCDGLEALPGLKEHALELSQVVLRHLLGLVRGDVATADERLGVKVAHGPLGLDEVVHARLGHRGVVALVVAAAAVADHVDDHVSAKLLAVLEGEPGGAHARLGVVAVHVEDRDLVALGDVSAVPRGSAVLRPGGESDLVVDDDVDGAAGLVAAQLRHVERLLDDALARERGVAVDQDRQDGVAVRRRVGAQGVELGADDAEQHRVDGLEVRRVGGQVDLGRLAAIGREDALCSQVVLDVAGALNGAGRGRPVELAEDLGVRLTRQVGKHIEAAAVGHADAHLVDAGARGGRQDRVHEGDERFAALEGEPLLAHVLGLQERLEGLRGVEAAEDAQVLLAGGLGVAVLEPLLEPRALLAIGDVHVFDTDGAAVRVAQSAEHLAHLPAMLAREAGGRVGAVEVPQGQAVRLHVEVGVPARARAQRVDVGHEVPARAIGVDQFGDASGLARSVASSSAVSATQRTGSYGTRNATNTRS